MGLFSGKKQRGPPALREMPVAPGVGKVRAHGSGGAVNIRFDSVRGPAAEAGFTRMFGITAGQAAEWGQRAWTQGTKFRVYTAFDIPVKGAPPPAAPAQPKPEREVRRLDIGDRVSLFALEAEAGGKLGRAFPVYWSDLTHTCEANWAKRFSDRLGAWVEGNVDSPSGSEPLGFEAIDFAWHGPVYLRGAAMPLEIAGVAETFRGIPPPKEEAVKAVVYPGGRASDPDEFDITGLILSVTEAKYEGGRGFILKLQVGPIEWVDVWVRENMLARVPKAGEGAEVRARLFGLWAGQRTADLSMG